jgi:hypothetical protein
MTRCKTPGFAFPSGDEAGQKGPSPTATTGAAANPELLSTTVSAGEIPFTGEDTDSGGDSNANRLFEFLQSRLGPTIRQEMGFDISRK